MGENEQLYQQKMTHDSENMWEQRYQELLGKYLFFNAASSHCRRRWLKNRGAAARWGESLSSSTKT